MIPIGIAYVKHLLTNNINRPLSYLCFTNIMYGILKYCLEKGQIIDKTEKIFKIEQKGLSIVERYTKTITKLILVQNNKHIIEFNEKNRTVRFKFFFREISNKIYSYDLELKIPPYCPVVGETAFYM